MNKIAKYIGIGVIGIGIVAGSYFGFSMISGVLNDKEPEITSNTNPKRTPNKPEVVESPNKDEIFNLINKERERNGNSLLVRDERLDTSAQMKADEMASEGYYSHYNPTTGRSGGQFVFDQAPGVCKLASENLAKNINAGRFNYDVANGWFNSPPHYAAILDSKYTLAGIGLAKLPDENYYYIVQHFCEVR